MPTFYIGIDIQIRRNCCYAVIEGMATLVDSGWFSKAETDTDFSACKPGPKDMLDSWVAAATVREFIEGRGSEVGDGDGMGSIVLPRPLPEPVIKEVLRWPQ